jgi:thioredoxin reductase
MNKSIIIIGAGIAGLSAGCYGQLNGYQTKIFELPFRPAASAPPGSARATPSTAACTGLGDRITSAAGEGQTAVGKR